MKKSLLLLLAACMLSLASGAVTLGPNQKLLGHYTTDDLAETGWGKSFFNGVIPVATDLTADELALFQGSKVVAFRVGLAESAPVTRVFVIPVKGDGTLLDADMAEWTCDASSAGWNVIELATPYLINLPADYSLRIGFDYEQPSRTSKPLSAVEAGDQIYTTYHYKGGKWMNYGVSTTGNLSVQLICENENFPEYVLRMQNLSCKSTVKTGDPLSFRFEAYNLGAISVSPGAVVYNVAIDGNVVTTVSNPVALSTAHTAINGVADTEGLAAGEHTLTVTTATLNGEPIENPTYLTATFKTFEFGFTRQMHVVEQFTSTGCTWCPVGSANLQNLCNMRDDVAWVGVHVLFGSPVDPFATAQSDTLQAYQGIDGYPEGTFDRTMGIGDDGYLYTVLSGTAASTMSTFFDYVSDNNPSWATVNINSTFDEATREANITVDGELVPGFDGIMGEDARLTVYITEDNLVAAQINQGTLVNDYVHNGVLRQALGSVKGVALKKNGDAYKNEFTLTIPSAWKAEDLNIVAFISRPLRANSLTDLYITNANKRALGIADVKRGDVDGDGEVTIADVTALIDYLLSGDETGINLGASDCDLDGEITIGDVTTLIDFLLSGQWSE